MPQENRRVNVEFLLLAFALGAALSFLPIAAPAQGNEEVRERFLVDLSRAILGNEEIFYEINEKEGWRGVLLAQPGSSISPLTEAYTGLPGELSQSLANAAVFDRPVEIKNGYAMFLPSSLDNVWRTILDMTRPRNPLPLDRMATAQVMKWLFSPRYNGGEIVGYTREPSRYMNKYREFESLYSQLLRGRSNDMWRLDPQLRTYASFEHAQRVILDEWFKSGYKAEVDSATWSFGVSGTTSDWSGWAAVKFAFDTFRKPIDLYNKVPETYLIPPPSSWSSVSTWIRFKSSIGDNQGDLRYQLARIRVSRPWFDVEALLDGRLSMRNNETIISSGDTPKFSSGPTGVLPGFIEELILSRGIIYQGSGEFANFDHPLSLFSYPESINLVGYVVRILPAVENNDPFQSEPELVGFEN